MTGPRPQRIKCAWAFFSQPTLKLSRGQIQCKAEITLCFRRGCGCGRTRCQAPNCLSGVWCLPIWDSVSLAKITPVSDTFSRVPTKFCRCLPGHPHWAPSASHSGKFPLSPGAIDTVGLARRPSVHDQKRVHTLWDGSLANE